MVTDLHGDDEDPRTSLGITSELPEEAPALARGASA